MTSRTTRSRRTTDRNSALQGIVTAALDDMKAVNVKVLDVRGVTDFTDTIIIASGNSDRHVRSIADRVVEKAKEAGYRKLGLEGERDGEWVLVDLNDVIVHVMLPRVREFYGLEHLWDTGKNITPAAAAKSSASAARKAPAKRAAAKTPRKTAARSRPRGEV